MLYTLSGVDAQRVRALPDAAQHRDLRADVQRRGDRPPRRRPRRPPLRPQRAYHGMPEGHLPVRSYLAVPVITARRRGAGGLFFGHPEPGMFSDEDERMVAGSRPSRRSRSRTRALPGAHATAPRRCSARCCRRTCPRSPGSSWPRATAPRARATRSAATSTTSSRRPRPSGPAIGDVWGKGPQAAGVTASCATRCAPARTRRPRRARSRSSTGSCCRSRSRATRASPAPRWPGSTATATGSACSS